MDAIRQQASLSLAHMIGDLQRAIAAVLEANNWQRGTSEQVRLKVLEGHASSLAKIVESADPGPDLDRLVTMAALAEAAIELLREWHAESTDEDSWRRRNNDLEYRSQEFLSVAGQLTGRTVATES